MNEFGGPESFTPGEGSSGASEQVSEQAKQRFAQAQQQIKQIAKEEKKARKRDDRVAQTIKQFMADDKYVHLFQLISRLVARDCPSIFVLAVLSLIHKESLDTVEEFISEQHILIDAPDREASDLDNAGLPPEVRQALLFWTTRLELVLNMDAEKILSRLMVDESNIDGSVLQFTTFVLVDFFDALGREVTYEAMQPLTVKILQDIIEPHMEAMEKYFAAIRAEKEGTPDEAEEA